MKRDADEQRQQQSPEATHHQIENSAARRIAALQERRNLSDQETRAAIQVMVNGTTTALRAADNASQTPDEALQSLQTLRDRGLIDHAEVRQTPGETTPWYLTALGEREASAMLQPALEDLGREGTDVPEDLVATVATALAAAITEQGQQPQP